MLGIFAYAIGVMYSPGPINLLALHGGIQGKARAQIGFYIGVGIAMLILFLLLSYIGNKLVSTNVLPYISIFGCSYIVYLSFKVLKSNITFSHQHSENKTLRFRDGLFMHIFNPKAFVATLPIATIQFPAENITGIQIFIWSLILSTIACGAPSFYGLIGSILGKKIENPVLFSRFNQLMFVLLIYVAATIGYDNIYLPLMEYVPYQRLTG